MVIVVCQRTTYLSRQQASATSYGIKKPGISGRPRADIEGAAAVEKGGLTAKSGSEKASLTGANMVMPWLVPFKLYCSPLLCSPISQN